MTQAARTCPHPIHFGSYPGGGHVFLPQALGSVLPALRTRDSWPCCETNRLLEFIFYESIVRRGRTLRPLVARKVTRAGCSSLLPSTLTTALTPLFNSHSELLSFRAHRVSTARRKDKRAVETHWSSGLKSAAVLHCACFSCKRECYPLTVSASDGGCRHTFFPVFDRSIDASTNHSPPAHSTYTLSYLHNFRVLHLSRRPILIHRLQAVTLSKLSINIPHHPLHRSGHYRPTKRPAQRQPERRLHVVFEILRIATQAPTQNLPIQLGVLTCPR